ncbi:MAG: vitamin K epoxide reductase family protein [Candidatus Poseidoniaceae archaeon]|jgi:uncharacterized membrane protein|nr:vitamin K epoxide reductase family protein [Candidatus Poseidoniaceae archaeon]
MDWWLIGHLTPVIVGAIIASPLGTKIASSLGANSEKFSWLATKRDRLLGGLIMVCFGGFTVSAHTLWFHNKFHELGSSGIGCSAFGIFDCASVIANDAYNSDPLFGAPWGVVGMLAFAMFGWLALTVLREPNASWVETHLKVGVGGSAVGVVIALYLVYVEIFPLEGVFCQYCTTAHIADLISLMIFFKLLSLKEGGHWLSSDEKDAENDVKKIAEIRTERKKRGGYVAPTSSAEEE